MPKAALRGGSPIRTAPLPTWPQRDSRELANLTHVLESGNWGDFPSPNVMAGKFAEKFAAYQGATYGDHFSPRNGRRAPSRADATSVGKGARIEE